MDQCRNTIVYIRPFSQSGAKIVAAKAPVDQITDPSKYVRLTITKMG